VVVLIRHSARNPFPKDNDGKDTPITPEGWQLARQLGILIGNRLSSLHISPLLRCEQTAYALNEGAGKNCLITSDYNLGEPSVYINDESLASQTWAEIGNEGVMAHQVQTSEPLPGMVAAAPAARQLLQHMFATADSQPGMHIFVTHDSVLAPTIAHLMGNPFSGTDWPTFLDAVFFWQENEKTIGEYRGKSRTVENFAFP
jgi:broad specificity phosphatase PhoE